MPRYFIEISYCGTAYKGWQIQDNTPLTIQKILSDVLSVTLKHTIMPTGCGRTDAGVHARKFYAHFDSETIMQAPINTWLHKWNAMLPNDITIHNIYAVHKDAHARYSAISRTYEYHIHQKKDSFLHPYSWYLYQPLEHHLIIKAIDILKQHQDFACFSKNTKEYKHTLCNIYSAEWKVSEDKIVFTISANRFLQNMVRAIVGTLIWVGTRKISLKDFEDILQSKSRTKAGFSAPAHGLYLMSIKYPKEIFLI